MFMRFLGYVFLTLALAALAFDGTRMIADNGQLAFTSVQQHWLTLAPDGLEATKTALEQVNGYLWSPLLMTVLVLPAWMVACGFGTLFYIAGYKRPKPAIPDGI